MVAFDVFAVVEFVVCELGFSVGVDLGQEVFDWSIA